MKVSDYMKTNYKELGATLADFVQAVSLDWTDLTGIGLPDDLETTVQITDAAGNELSDLLPFDKEHPAQEIDLTQAPWQTAPPIWAEMFKRKILDIQPGDPLTSDYKIILE